MKSLCVYPSSDFNFAWSQSFPELLSDFTPSANGFVKKNDTERIRMAFYYHFSARPENLDHNCFWWKQYLRTRDAMMWVVHMSHAQKRLQHCKARSDHPDFTLGPSPNLVVTSKLCSATQVSFPGTAIRQAWWNGWNSTTYSKCHYWIIMVYFEWNKR